MQITLNIDELELTYLIVALNKMIGFEISKVRLNILNKVTDLLIKHQNESLMCSLELLKK